MKTNLTVSTNIYVVGEKGRKKSNVTEQYKIHKTSHERTL